MDCHRDKLATESRRGGMKEEVLRLRKSQTSDLNPPEASEPPRKVLRKRLSFSSFDSEDSKRTKSIRQAAHKLRLPSFDLLGIGNQQASASTSQTNTITRGQLAFNSCDPSSLKFRQYLYSTFNCPSILTPPDEENSEWRLPDWERHTQSEPRSLERDFFSTHPKSHHMASLGESSTPSIQSTDTSGSSKSDKKSPSSTPDELAHDAETIDPTLDEAIRITVSTLASSSTSDNAIRVLSQTLPCPPADKSKIPSSPVGAFSTALDAIQAVLPTIQAPYINVTHAVPLKFSLTNLPNSPPVTPALSSSTNDYFTTTVFRNAVPIESYQDLTISSRTSNVPVATSPRPAVPPNSVHISLVERYIPPTSVEEDRDLFSPTGPSVLADRLYELAPHGGTLVFIYPTKVGAKDFTRCYLGPILDPMLRNVTVINSLSTSLASALGTMVAPDRMASFEELKHKINNLCLHLNRSVNVQNSTSLSTTSPYSILYSNKGYAYLERHVWAQWWIHQETPREKDIISAYWRNGQYLPENKELTSSALLRHLLEGIHHREYDPGAEPKAGIEVGVFVISRS